MQIREYAALDATALADLIRTRQVSAAEVESAARSAIAAVEPDLNALTGPVFDVALTAEPHGVFGGVPALVKDASFARGVPFALGSRAIRGAIAPTDHPLMTAFRAAGLVALGQTTSPELALNFATESLLYGVTRNPWDLQRGPGGSSGGAAALVAAGAVPIAHASDGAGSIRIPASACGLVGLKPGRDRAPSGPPVAAGGKTLGIDFALTRSVRDSAVLLDAVTGAPASGWLEVAPAPLRIGFSIDAWGGHPVDPQVAAATESAASMLEWIGHSVTPARPELDEHDIVEACMLALHAAGAALTAAPRPPDVTLLEGVSRRILLESSTADASAAIAAQRRVTKRLAAFFADHDVLVTPTLAQVPVRHGTLDYNDTDVSARHWLRRMFEFGPFTAPANVAGLPAVSVPVGHSREGLPIGVQLIAASGRERSLLQLARQLEQALPWAQRRPIVWAG